MCEFFPHDFFCKNFVKLNILLKSYTVNQFDEKFSQWGKFLKFPHCAIEKMFDFHKKKLAVFNLGHHLAIVGNTGYNQFSQFYIVIRRYLLILETS